MTVETTSGGEPITKSGPYNGNGVTAAFDYDFQVQAETEVLVTRQNADLTETVLTLTTHYTVSGVGNDAGGQITLVDPATDLPTGAKLIITYDGDYNQSTDYSNQGSIQLSLLEAALDKMTMHLRGLKEAVDRAVTVDAFGTTDVATLRANVAALALIEADISALAAIVADVTTAAAVDAEIVTVSGIAANVPTVAGVAANVTTVAGIAANVTTVAGIAANVTTVAGVSADVTAVAGISADVTTAAAVDAEIVTVAGISADVATVASVAASIVAAAAVDAEIVTVAGIAANVPTVAGIAANVTTVAGVSADVTTVAGIAANVTTVAGISADVSALAAGTGGTLTGQWSITGYVTATADADGTFSSGTYTPTPVGGNFKTATNNGAFTLAAPSAAGDYTLIIQITNGATAGAVTMSGFAVVNGDDFTTTNGHKFNLYITKLNGSVSAMVEALQ